MSDAANRQESLHHVGANYYVLIPFQTARVALSAAEDIGKTFDCCVVSRAAVDQDAPLVTEPKL